MSTLTNIHPLVGPCVQLISTHSLFCRSQVPFIGHIELNEHMYHSFHISLTCEHTSSRTNVCPTRTNTGPPFTGLFPPWAPLIWAYVSLIRKSAPLYEYTSHASEHSHTYKNTHPANTGINSTHSNIRLTHDYTPDLNKHTSHSY